MADRESAHQGREARGGGDDLGRRVATLERTVTQQAAQIKEMQTPPVDCAFCGGTGKQLSGDTWIKLDVHNRPVPCPICQGKGKVRV